MAEVWTPPTFDDIATSETVTAAYLNQLGNSLRFLKRVGVATFTSTVNVTSTNSASPDTIVSLGSITYEAVPHLFEFYCPQVNGINASVNFLQFYDTSSVIARVHAEARVTNALNYQVYVAFEYTPTAAAHTYSIRGYNSSAGTWAFQAGDGFATPGATTNAPGYLRVTRVPT